MVNFVGQGKTQNKRWFQLDRLSGVLFLFFILIGIGCASAPFPLVVALGVFIAGVITLHAARLWLLLLIAGTVLFARKFSYVHFDFGNIPFFYITEIVLFLLCFSIVVSRLVQGDAFFKKTPMTLPILGFILVGLGLLINDFLRGYGILAVRRFAIVYYSVFYFVIVELVQNHRAFKTVVKSFYLSSFLLLIGEIIGPLFFNIYLPEINSSVVNPPVAYITYSGIVLIFLITASDVLMKSRKAVGILVALYSSIFIISPEVRTGWVALSVAIFFVFIISNRFGIRIWILKRIPIVLYVILLLIALELLFSGSSVVETYIELTASMFAWIQDKYDYNIKSMNALWRIEVWKEALRQVSLSPFWGIGFGGKFFLNQEYLIDRGLYFSEIRGDIHGLDIHNSHLAILLRMGIIGFVIYLWINYSFYKQCLNFIEYQSNREARLCMLAIMGAYFFYLTVASFCVALEGPYMGIFFWMLIGMGTVLTRIFPIRLTDVQTCSERNVQ